MKHDLRNVACGLLLCSFALLPCAARGQWVQTNGPYGGVVNCLTASGANLYAGTDGGVYESTDSGRWRYKGLQEQYGIYGIAVTFTGDTIVALAGSYPGPAIYLSTDNGAQWNIVDSASSIFYTSPVYVGKYLFIVASNPYSMPPFTPVWIQRSTDDGAHWSEMDSGLTLDMHKGPLVVAGGTLYTGTSEGVFRSTDTGATWTAANAGIEGVFISALAVSGDTLFAASDINDTLQHDTAQVYRSTDGGATWASTGLNGLGASTLAFHDGQCLAGNDSGIFFLTTSMGQWENSSRVSSMLLQHPSAIKFLGENIYAGTNEGVIEWFPYLYLEPEWEGYSDGLAATFINSFAATDTNIFVLLDNMLYRGSANNVQWLFTTDFYPAAMTKIASYNGALYAGATDSSGIYRSTDGGHSWAPAGNGVFPFDHAQLPGGIVIRGGHNGVYRTTDAGIHWTYLKAGNFVDWGDNITPETFFGNALFAIFYEGGVVYAPGQVYAGRIYVSFDTARQWMPSGVGFAYTLYRSGNHVYAGTTQGVYRLNADDTSWTDMGLDNYIIMAFADTGGELFAGTYEGKVFLSTNDGVSWSDVSDGLAISNLSCLAIADGYLYAGTGGVDVDYAGEHGDRGVWRRPLSEMITGVAAPPAPAQLALAQNYPNPFSTTTTITIDAENISSLKVYNVLGKEVADLTQCIARTNMDGQGRHSVVFDAGGLPAGVYFYRLAAGRFSQTGMMEMAR